MQFDSASFLPDLGLIANQKKLCQSIFQNARFLESGNQNANMATLSETRIVLFIVYFLGLPDFS